MPRAKSVSRTVSPNRTDLIGAGPIPNEQGPSQQYGERAAQQAAQQVIPMAPTQISAGPAPTAASPSAGPPPVPVAPSPGDVLAQAQAHNGPGASLALNRPTERPDEPVTHGLPVGPGAGPEALTGVGAIARDNVMGMATMKQLLTTLAAAPGAPSAVQDLASRAQNGVQ